MPDMKSTNLEHSMSQSLNFKKTQKISFTDQLQYFLNAHLKLANTEKKIILHVLVLHFYNDCLILNNRSLFIHFFSDIVYLVYVFRRPIEKKFPPDSWTLL